MQSREFIKLINEDYSGATLATYLFGLKKIVPAIFASDEIDVYATVSDYTAICKSIVTSAEISKSSQKVYLSAILYIYKLQRNKQAIEHVKKEISKLNIKIQVDVQTKLQQDRKPISEAYEIMQLLCDNLKTLKIQLTGKHDESLQKYVFGYIMFHLGGLRADDLYRIKVISEGECADDINVLCIANKTLTIKKHKGDSSKMGMRIISLEQFPELLDVVLPACGKYLFLTNRLNPYTSAASFARKYDNLLNATIYTYRRCAVSIALHERDVERIKSLEIIHGHTLTIMQQFYYCYM